MTKSISVFRRRWRYLWALPWTAFGLLAAAVVRLGGGRVRIHGGALEAQGGGVRWLCQRLPPHRRFEAITLGHVILALDAQCLDAARAHEWVHVRQYERWGPFFVPAYLASSAWQWMRGRRPYLDNPFEREAYALAAGAHERPVE